MIVKIEMDVDAIQEAYRRVKVKKAAAEIIKKSNNIVKQYFMGIIRPDITRDAAIDLHIAGPSAEQIEQERRKAEENNETREDG